MRRFGFYSLYRFSIFCCDLIPDGTCCDGPADKGRDAEVLGLVVVAAFKKKKAKHSNVSKHTSTVYLA